MNNFRHFKTLRAVLSFMAVLTLFIGIASIMIFSSQRELLLHEKKDHTQKELALIGALSQDAILKHDYATVDSFLQRWGKEHEEVAELQAIMPNQFVIGAYKNESTARSTIELIHEQKIGERTVLTLKIVKDLTYLDHELDRLRRTTMLSSLGFVVFLGYFLWLTFNKTAMKPLRQEISERMKTEQALTESDQRFRDVADNALEFIWEVDAKGTYTYANSAVESILGYTAQELLGRHFYDHFHPDHRNELKEGVSAIFTRKEPFREFLNPNVHNNGKTVWLLTSGVPVLGPNRQLLGYRGSDIDISKLKESEEELKRMTGKLEESNKNLTDFAHIASHDLQEPLRKITAFGDRLNSKCADALGDQGRDYLERMQSAARRMQTLIQGLLSYSRVTTKAKPFESIDLNTVVKGVLADLEIRIEEMKGRVEAGDLPTIMGDPLQMRQLLQNLIGNALKFNKKDVPPVVTLHYEQLYAANLGQFHQITVADNGIGFDEQYADRIFGVFQRLHGRTEYDGTGIGLSVCKKIVERHEGTITASSKDQEGATFTIKLPVLEQTNPVPEETEEDHELVSA